MRSDKWGYQFARQGSAELLSRYMATSQLFGPRMVRRNFVARHNSKGNSDYSESDADFPLAPSFLIWLFETIEAAWRRHDDFLRVMGNPRQMYESSEIPWVMKG